MRYTSYQLGYIRAAFHDAARKAVNAAAGGGMNEKRGALAGPESAAEHVRNALQLLGFFEEDVRIRLRQELPYTVDSMKGALLDRVIPAARARLVAALAILEQKS
jgi:hypothetical protein